MLFPQGKVVVIAGIEHGRKARRWFVQVQYIFWRNADPNDDLKCANRRFAGWNGDRRLLVEIGQVPENVNHDWHSAKFEARLGVKFVQVRFDNLRFGGMWNDHVHVVILASPTLFKAMAN